MVVATRGATRGRRRRRAGGARSIAGPVVVVAAVDPDLVACDRDDLCAIRTGYHVRGLFAAWVGALPIPVLANLDLRGNTSGTG